MKKDYIDGQVHIIAETQDEALYLISVVFNGAPVTIGLSKKASKAKEEDPIGPHTRKRNYSRECNVLGCKGGRGGIKKFKGLVGLGIHKYKVHGIESPLHPRTNGSKDNQCPVCPVTTSTVSGLAIHKSKMHNIVGRNNKYYVKRTKGNEKTQEVATVQTEEVPAQPL